MNLVLLAHPLFLGLGSQDRYAALLAEGLAARGHRVQVRRPRARLHAHAPARLAKWAGYVDQYGLFARELRAAAAADPPDTLYVFCDQALGPWVPLLAHRPHVVHCHDLLALRSALGLVPENPTRWSGRVYQRWIRAGLRQARHVVSISEASRADLHRHAGLRPQTSCVVPNPLNHPYRRLDTASAHARLAAAGLPRPGPQGFVLHVGGGQWYKNTAGVVALHAALAARADGAPPALWLVSPPPDAAVRQLLAAHPPQAEVRFFQQLPAPVLEALYSLAQALLFPSLAEGFGWPIAEALACGCPVLTTGEAPMTEVGGPHALYLPRLASAAERPRWAASGAEALAALLRRPAPAREAAAAAAIAWARRYEPAAALDAFVGLYASVLAREGRALDPPALEHPVVHR